MWPRFLPPLPWRDQPLTLTPDVVAPPTPMAHIQGEIPVSLSDRWFILGMTWSGKTTFAQRLVKELLALYPYTKLYVVDSKGDDKFAEWPTRSFSAEPPALVRTPGASVVWSPPWDDVSAYDSWLERIFNAREPAIVFLDELSSLGGKHGNDFPLNLARVLKQGRSNNICAIVLSQEAAYIPRTVIGQASHAAIFRLQDDIDLRRAAKLLNFSAARNPAAEHGFWYRRLSPRPGPTLEYPGMQQFFG